jgi:Uma2 family endonuclease
MTIRNSPPPSLDEWQWPGDLCRPDRPITSDFYFKLPEGPPYYQLIEGNLVLQWYTGGEDLVRPARPVTADLFFQIPEGPPYYQLIEGIIVMSPSPTFYHQTLLLRLSQCLQNYLDEHPIGVVVFSPCDVRLENTTVYHPDLFFVRNGNPRVVIDRTVEGPPDLVVEILSPSNFREDRIAKRAAYARAGVEEMWIVDPEARQIEIYPLAKGLDVAPMIVHEPDSFSPALFPGLTIETTRLFKPLI